MSRKVVISLFEFWQFATSWWLLCLSFVYPYLCGLSLGFPQAGNMPSSYK